MFRFHRPFLGRLLLGVACAAFAFSTPLTAFAATETEGIESAAEQSSPEGDYLAGRFAAQNRDMAAAAIYLGEALRADPKNAELLDQTFRVTLASGDISRSAQLAERLLRIDKDNRLARMVLAIRAVKSGKYATARTQLVKSLHGPLPDVVAALVTAWTWQGSGNYRRAIKAADSLGGNELAELFRDLHAGLIAEVAGHKRDAEKRLKAAYDKDQTSFIIVDAYARRAARAGDMDTALEAYEGLAKLAPRNARVQAAIAGIKSGRKPEPLVRNAREGVAEVLFGFGQLANRSESAEISLVYLNLALYLQPDNEFALLTLADLYETLEQHDNAIAAYKRISPNSIFAKEIGVRIALNLAEADREDEAEAQLLKMVAADPKNDDALVALGNIQQHKKKYKEAAETFTKAIDLLGTPTRSDWTLYFARGVAYDLAKDWPKAEADLKKSLDLDPTQAVVLNYLGYSWVDRGIDMPKGMDLIRKAVELRPNDGDIVDSLGWAYYQQGHYDEALTELERAIDLKPQSWEINDHLGDVYWKVGRKLDAKFQWLHALTYDVDADKRPLIERKIRDGLESVEAETEQKRNEGGDGGQAAPKPASPAPLKLPENRTEGKPQPNHASVEGPTETR